MDEMQEFPVSHKKAADIQNKITYKLDDFWKILDDKSLKSNFLIKKMKEYVNDIAEMFVDEY